MAPARVFAAPSSLARWHALVGGVLSLLLASRIWPDAWHGQLLLGLCLVTLGAAVWLVGRGALLSACTSGICLALLSLLQPQVWCGAVLALAVVVGAAARELGRAARAALLGLGVGFPAVLYAVLAASGQDARHALALAFDPRLSATGALRSVLVIGCSSALGLCSLGALRSERRPVLPPGYAWAALGLLPVWLLLRAAWIGSIAGLHTDLLVWSEAPALVNLLKLRAGEVFYGPPELLNSYSYSPGLELLQYGLLAPLGWELSLSAHRALGVTFQLTSAGVLWLALRPGLSRDARRGGAPALLLLAAACSSLLSPHLHPDHALLLCFCVAIALVVRWPPLRPASGALLLSVPVAATVFKLTGAGVGLGLVLVALWERDFRKLLVLGASGGLALSTIPLFDATLGEFSRYAIELQASHPMDWYRLWSIPGSPAGMLWLVALLALWGSWRAEPQRESTRAAVRVALLTAGFSFPSLLGYLKHGGRDNSLMPLALGGCVIALLVLAQPRSDSEATVAISAVTPQNTPVLLLALAVLLMPSFEPIWGPARARLEEMYFRQRDWLAEGAARGQRRFTSSIAAYIGSGQRAVPHPVLSSVAELELAGSPHARAFEALVASGYFDGICVQNSELAQGAMWQRLRPVLDERYRVAGPPELEGKWPTALGGYVLLEKRSASAKK